MIGVPSHRSFFHVLAVLTLGATAMACASTSGPNVRIVGDHLELDDTIHFATGKSTIAQDSYLLLDRIAFVLKESPDIVAVKIYGHTDATGSNEFNQTLSEGRAAAVQAYLKDKGVTQKMQTKGFGHTNPVCSEKTDECRYRNRRVEFLIERG